MVEGEGIHHDSAHHARREVQCQIPMMETSGSSILDAAGRGRAANAIWQSQLDVGAR
jgi:hypothetical protein